MQYYALQYLAYRYNCYQKSFDEWCKYCAFYGTETTQSDLLLLNLMWNNFLLELYKSLLPKKWLEL